MGQGKTEVTTKQTPAEMLQDLETLIKDCRDEIVLGFLAVTLRDLSETAKKQRDLLQP